MSAGDLWEPPCGVEAAIRRGDKRFRHHMKRIAAEAEAEAERLALYQRDSRPDGWANKEVQR